MSTHRSTATIAGVRVQTETADTMGRSFTADGRRLLAWVSRYRNGRGWFTYPEPGLVLTFSRRGAAFRWLRARTVLAVKKLGQS